MSQMKRVLEAIDEARKEIVALNGTIAAYKDQSDAWFAIVDTLDKVAPGWLTAKEVRHLSAIDCAKEAIFKMAEAQGYIRQREDFINEKQYQEALRRDGCYDDGFYNEV